MLMQPVPMAQGISRPFVVGLVMLLLFLSMQTDWGSNKPQSGSRRADLRQLGLVGSPDAAELPTAREKIIYELSMSLDKLERENWQMKQHILDLRRNLRREGCDLNGTLYTFPELEKTLQSANDTQQLHFQRHRPKQIALSHDERGQADANPTQGSQSTHQRHQGSLGDSHRLRGSVSEQKDAANNENSA